MPYESIRLRDRFLALRPVRLVLSLHLVVALVGVGIDNFDLHSVHRTPTAKTRTGDPTNGDHSSIVYSCLKKKPYFSIL